MSLGHQTINISRRPCPVDGVINISADLATASAAEAATSAALDYPANKPMTCLVHNASLMLKDTIDSCADDELERVMRVNVSAINRINHISYPPWASSPACFTWDTLSEKAVAIAFGYVSKHAQLGIMRASCRDLAGTGIHTAMVCRALQRRNAQATSGWRHRTRLDRLTKRLCELVTPTKSRPPWSGHRQIPSSTAR